MMRLLVSHNKSLYFLRSVRMNWMSYVAIILSQINAASIFANANGYPTPTKSRRVQVSQTLNYRATYRADFQYILDPPCDGKPPAISIQCEGEVANMTILSTSDSSIECSKVDDPTMTGPLYNCVTNCSYDECGSVYPASNASTFFDGPFGSVEFMCEGDNYGNVRAAYTYLGENAACNSSTVATKTRNYHAGRLGVSCLTGSNRLFVFDDSYFECVAFPFPTPINTKEGNADAYTCVSGNDCLGAACNVTINPVYFFSDVPRFLDDCVEKTTTEIVGPPTASPVISSFQYTAQFEANWAVLYDPADAESNCTNVHGGAIISCENGSVITYLFSTDTSMMCTLLNESELNCIGSEDSISNQFTKVNYICTGPAIPTTRVNFLQSDAVCALVQETATVSHAVALGVVCTFDAPVTINFDTYVECASASHQFYAGASEYDFLSYFLFCSESVSFSLGASTTQQLISNVTIGTDNNYWLTLPDRSCYNFAPATQSPVSLAPAPVPTQPSVSPIEVITSSPILRDMSPTGISMNQSMNDGENVTGIVIGCVVAGLVLVAILGYFVFLNKRHFHQTTSKAFTTVEGNSQPDHRPSMTDEYPIIATPVDSSTSVVLASLEPSDAPAELSSPSKYLPDLKDQCRDVVMNKNTVTANEVRDALANNTLPVVKASGVRLVSEVSGTTNEPHGQPIWEV